MVEEADLKSWLEKDSPMAVASKIKSSKLSSGVDVANLIDVGLNLMENEPRLAPQVAEIFRKLASFSVQDERGVATSVGSGVLVRAMPRENHLPSALCALTLSSSPEFAALKDSATRQLYAVHLDSSKDCTEATMESLLILASNPATRHYASLRSSFLKEVCLQHTLSSSLRRKALATLLIVRLQRPQ
eukprot:m.20065 g.20065  ORF g.20065 m.20065 type:complete len:188 (+) comp7732_c0_seq1:99-662(+)